MTDLELAIWSAAAGAIALVVLATVRFGRGPGVVASLLAVLAFDLYLVKPYYSLSVADTEYLLTFAFMLAVSLIVSHLTANLRRQAVQDGMRPLRLAGALRVAEGLTVVEEILTCTPPLT